MTYVPLHGKLPREIVSIMKSNRVTSPLGISSGMKTANNSSVIKQVSLTKVDGASFLLVKYASKAQPCSFLYELSGKEVNSLRKKANQKKLPKSLQRLMRDLRLKSTNDLTKGMSTTYPDYWDDGTSIDVDVTIDRIEPDGTIRYSENTIGEDGREDYLKYKYTP
jgi:hypothetical protein